MLHLLLLFPLGIDYRLLRLLIHPTAVYEVLLLELISELYLGHPAHHGLGPCGLLLGAGVLTARLHLPLLELDVDQVLIGEPGHLQGDLADTLLHVLLPGSVLAQSFLSLHTHVKFSDAYDTINRDVFLRLRHVEDLNGVHNCFQPTLIIVEHP